MLGNDNGGHYNPICVWELWPPPFDVNLNFWLLPFPFDAQAFATSPILVWYLWSLPVNVNLNLYLITLHLTVELLLLQYRLNLGAVAATVGSGYGSRGCYHSNWI